MTDAIQAAAYRILEGTGTMDDAAAVSLAYFRMITARAQDALAKGGANFDDAVRLPAKPRPETITLIESAIQVGLSAKDILGALYAHLALAGSAAKPSRDEVLEAARNVHDTFKRDLDQGYRTKDKEFAVDLLGRALAIRALKSPAIKNDAAVAGPKE